MLSKPRKLSLSGSKLTLGNIDASKLRAGSSVGGARKAVQVEVRRNRAPQAPVNVPLFNTSEALRTGDITAGICAENINEVEIIINPMIRNEVFDPVALRKRTEVIRLIKGIKTTGDALGSTILSKDLSPYHQENELTEEEKTSGKYPVGQTHKVDMNSIRKFDQKEFMDALETIGFFTV